MPNPREEELRRLTMVKAMVRREIDTTRDKKKKEVYRKKNEQMSKQVDNLLKEMKIK